MSKEVKKKTNSRQRTKFRIRKRILSTTVKPRISIFRSSKHIYAQIVSDVDGKTLVAASTLDPVVKEQIKKNAEKISTKSIEAAKIVGSVLAEKAVKSDIKAVVFDRNGFNYAGRVKAVADGAREAGLSF